MKKLLLIALMTFLLTLTACGTDTTPVSADYSSPREAIQAYQSGTDIVGKTIKVVAAHDSYAGIIFDNPDTQVGANVYVTIITNDENRDGVLAIKEGETIVVTVDMIDDHLKYSIYIYALEYENYGKQ